MSTKYDLFIVIKIVSQYKYMLATGKTDRYQFYFKKRRKTKESFKKISQYNASSRPKTAHTFFFILLQSFDVTHQNIVAPGYRRNCSHIYEYYEIAFGSISRKERGSHSH